MNSKTEIPVQPWAYTREESMLICPIFEISKVSALSGSDGKKGDFFLIRSPDWVNIIPITAEKKVVLIKQFRFGSGEISLEIPGGIVEPMEDVRDTASRELREETGYSSEKLSYIGKVRPNPATHTNFCFSYLMMDAEVQSNKELDDHEEIETVLVELARIPDLIQDGSINHSLVINAFLFYQFHQLRLGNPDPWQGVML